MLKNKSEVITINDVEMSIGNPFFFISRIIASEIDGKERIIKPNKELKFDVKGVEQTIASMKQIGKRVYASIRTAPTGNLILFVLFSILFLQKLKSAPTEVSAPKNADPNCRQTNRND